MCCYNSNGAFNNRNIVAGGCSSYPDYYNNNQEMMQMPCGYGGQSYGLVGGQSNNYWQGNFNHCGNQSYYPCCRHYNRCGCYPSRCQLMAMCLMCCCRRR